MQDPQNRYEVVGPEPAQAEEGRKPYEILGGTESSTTDAPADARELLRQLLLAGEDKHFVFLFGSPASGKTAVLGGLLQAMQRPEVPGKLYVHGAGNGYFGEGAALWRRIRDAFGRQAFPPRTDKGKTIQLQAQYVPNAGEPLNLVFLEMAGEDLREVMITDAGGRALPFHILKFLKIPRLKLSFLVTTAWSDAPRDDETINDFLSFLSEEAPHLIENRFILLITKWDSKPQPAGQVDDFVRANMPRTYNKLAAKRNVIQPFSIGEVVSLKGAGDDIIASFDYPSSQRLFRRIYETFTGVPSEETKPLWWQFWK